MEVGVEVGVEVRCARMVMEVGCVRLDGGGRCESEVCETGWWRWV